MPKGIILMTALVPTKGHQNLIEFALQYMAKYLHSELHIIISHRDNEPVSGWTRVDAFREQFQARRPLNKIIVTSHYDNNAPQNPNGPDDKPFWDYWVQTIENITGTVWQEDILFASEKYGIDMAKALQCKFVPFDPYRQVTHARGTDVRKGLPYTIDQVMPAFQKHIVKRITIFGSESTGKTTLTRNLSRTGGQFLMEWARPYLETVGAELNAVKMATIFDGQAALQDMAKSLLDLPYIFQDTDLFSTIGYYRIFGLPVTSEMENRALARKSDLYVLTQSNIPFEEDPLRYGGDKRESDDKFWIDILEEYGLNYVVLKNNDPHLRTLEALDAIEAAFPFTDIKYFERE